ncbi:hypothetical protein EPO04_01475 [Patescibacteria group bacterium]|nr:MAG: hypothetical protein EPO04_01475 [Patescibacteria group bacterium]
MTDPYTHQQAELHLIALERVVERALPFLKEHGGQPLKAYTDESDGSCSEPFIKEPRFQDLMVVPLCGAQSWVPLLQPGESARGSILLVLDSSKYPARWLAWLDHGTEDEPQHEIGALERDQLLRLFKDPKNDYLPQAIGVILKEEVERCGAELLAYYRESVLIEGDLDKILVEMGLDGDGDVISS